MTRHILIGVGGSGQHVVHAYLRLLSLAFPCTEKVPHVMIFDADAHPGSQGAEPSLIDSITALHKYLVSGDKTPARCEIIKPYRTNEAGEASSSVLGQLIGVAGVDSVRKLADGFLADDQEEWGNDWQIELGKGMMANPKVGSIALAHKAKSLGPGESKLAVSQFGSLFSLLDARTRVAIVGSNFGGTGSGVIPALVRLLDLQNIDSVRAFMMLPWFTLDVGETGVPASAARNRDEIDPKERNSSLGLHAYYDDLRSGLERSTYVLSQSMRDWPSARRIDAGNSNQPENRHVLNLVQACAVQAFLGIGPTATHGVQLFSLRTTAAGESKGQFDARNSPHLRFRVGVDDSRQLADLAADAEATAFVLDRAGSVLAATQNGRPMLEGNAGEIPDAALIDQFVQVVAEALDKKPVDHRRLSNFFRKQTAAPDDVYHQLGEAMVELARRVRGALAWFDGHAVGGAQADSAGVSEYSGAHLFGGRDFASLGERDRQLARNWAELQLRVKSLTGDGMAGTSPSNQAFSLFSHVFATPAGAKGDAPLLALINEFDRERKASESAAAPLIAARVIAAAVHQRVVAAREHVRRKDKAKDAHQRESAKADDAGQPMLRLLALSHTSVADVRLTQIDVEEELLGPENRYSRFDPDHPKSLRYLDPYAGAPLTNGRPNLAAHRGIEHALRGIPNIAAPRLLQKWRLEKCRPADEKERRGDAYEIEDGRVRATPAGIYLHAQRVNEAGFWLLATADPRIAFEADLFTNGNRATPFAQMLQSELRLGAGLPLPALVFAQGSTHAGKPMLLWGGDGWYLAANNAARVFFRELLPELPTVRRCFLPDQPLQRLATPDDSARKPMDTYFLRELEGLLARIDSRGVDLQGTSLAVLRTVIDDIAGDLSSQRDGAANLQTHRYKPRKLWLRVGDSVADIDVAPHRMIADFHEMRCDTPVVFLYENQSPSGLLPIKAEAWRMLAQDPNSNQLVLSPGGGSDKVDGRSLALRHVQRLDLNIDGIGPIALANPFGTRPLPAVKQEIGWTFGIWPNFIADKWGYYIISGTARIGDLKGQSPSVQRSIDTPWARNDMEIEIVVKGRAPGGHGNVDLEVLGRITGNGLSQRIYGRPEVIELVIDNRVLGSRRLDLAKAPETLDAYMLGIDFGTSNTCMAIQEKEKEAATRKVVPLLPGGALGDIATTELLGYVDSSNARSDRQAFLQLAATFFHVKSDNDAVGDTLPSELIVALHEEVKAADRQKAVLSQSYGRDSWPLHDKTAAERRVMINGYPLVSPLLTPLSPKPRELTNETNINDWLRSMVRSGDGRLFGDLKWPRSGDPDFSRSRSLRALYLEHVVVAALAVLRSKGYVGFQRFVATQPEAMSALHNEFAGTFNDDLQNVVRELALRTGMSSPEIKIELVSETVAALRMARLHNTMSRDSVLTIDIGGGTTDVGVNLRYFNADAESNRHLHTASARFAGNRLLDALAAVKEVRQRIQDADDNKQEKYTLDAMKSLLKSRLRRNQGSLVRDRTTATLTKMFFDAVFEYAFNLLRDLVEAKPEWLDQFRTDPTQRVRVALLGNGFKLFEAFHPTGGGETLVSYCANVLERLAASGVLPDGLAGRIEFTLPETTKSGLIRSGGFDAASVDDHYKADERLVLLPAGITSTAPGTETKTLERAELIPFLQFRNHWVDVDDSNGKARRTVSFKVSPESLPRRFPLTSRYWDAKRHSDDVRSLFPSGREQSEYYMDPGALYLCGETALEASRSFSWLMVDFAERAP